jgi:phytoene synthase
LFERKSVLESSGDAAYRVCRDITRDASKTFFLASQFLGPEQRRAVWAVYAFCRTADDIVDRTGSGPGRVEALDSLERRLIAASGGYADEPMFVAYADATRRFEIPLAPALELLRGARMDISVRRYATFEELREYCYLVASTVGLLVSPILGYRAPEALDYGIALGHAMQLTNILRDVGEDAAMGRIYLPMEDLERFGFGEAHIFERVVDEKFVALMRFEIARVRELYAAAEPGIALLDPSSRYPVRLALSLYRRILGAIERNGYDVFTRRAFVPLPAKLATAATLAFAS